MSKLKKERITSLIVGECYLFESVTSKIYVGRLLTIEYPYCVILEDAAWVSETGRLHAFMRDGQAENMEIEPLGLNPVHGGIKCVHWAEWSPWPFPLLKEVV